MARGQRLLLVKQKYRKLRATFRAAFSRTRKSRTTSASQPSLSTDPGSSSSHPFSQKSLETAEPINHQALHQALPPITGVARSPASIFYAHDPPCRDHLDRLANMNAAYTKNRHRRWLPIPSALEWRMANQQQHPNPIPLWDTFGQPLPSPAWRHLNPGFVHTPPRGDHPGLLPSVNSAYLERAMERGMVAATTRGALASHMAPPLHPGPNLTMPVQMHPTALAMQQRTDSAWQSLPPGFSPGHAGPTGRPTPGGNGRLQPPFGSTPPQDLHNGTQKRNSLAVAMDEHIDIVQRLHDWSLTPADQLLAQERPRSLEYLRTQTYLNALHIRSALHYTTLRIRSRHDSVFELLAVLKERGYEFTLTPQSLKRIADWDAILTLGLPAQCPEIVGLRLDRGQDGMLGISYEEIRCLRRAKEEHLDELRRCVVEAGRWFEDVDGWVDELCKLLVRVEIGGARKRKTSL